MNIASHTSEDFRFDVRGYDVLQGALTPQQLKEINQWIDDHPVTGTGQWIGNVETQAFEKNDGVNYQNIIEGGAVFEELIDNPHWIERVKRYIGIAGLSINEAFINVRGQGGHIGIHSGGHIPWFICSTKHHTGAWMCGQINILVALNDIGPGDGATTLVPGSHKATHPHPILSNPEGKLEVFKYGKPAGEAEGMIEAHLKAGEALMFTDGVCHGSSARINPGHRRILIYRYSPANFVPRFNYVPTAELLSRLSPDRKRIVQPIPPRGPQGL